jgi:hypothetical protein
MADTDKEGTEQQTAAAAVNTAKTAAAESAAPNMPSWPEMQEWVRDQIRIAARQIGVEAEDSAHRDREDFKSWVRREMQHAANGLTEADRRVVNR